MSYNQSLAGFRLNRFALALVLISVLTGTFFARRLYYQYNPQPWVYAENLNIGGWLILIGIGVILSPIRVLIDVVSNSEFFNQNVWTNLINNEDFGLSLKLGILFLAELIYNCLYIVFGILIVILFFARRTSLPRLMIIYLSVGIAMQIIDAYTLYMISPELYEQSEPNQMLMSIAQAIVAGAIWIPYFFYSERVKSTFCKSLS